MVFIYNNFSCGIIETHCEDYETYYNNINLMIEGIKYSIE